MRRAVESVGVEDEKRQVGKEDMCNKEARRRVSERRRAVDSCVQEERRRAVARRRGGKL